MMEELDRLEIPAGARVTLEPGGLHLMLLQVSEPLAIGATFDLELDFTEAGEVSVSVPVVRPDALVSGAEPDDHHDHDTSGTEEER